MAETAVLQMLCPKEELACMPCLQATCQFWSSKWGSIAARI